MSPSVFLRPLLATTVALLLLVLSQGLVFASDCFNCHNSDAFEKRINHMPVAAGDCLACHSAHVARFEGLLQQQVNELCFSCHGDVIDAQTAQSLIHQPVRRGECMSCHEPHASDHQGLLTGDLADTCFSCHDEIARSYENTHAPYASGDCAACHVPHQSEYPNLLVNGGDDLCLECHSSATVREKHTGFPVPPANCSSCHNPHGSQRKGLIRDVLHAAYESGCTDCHVGSQPVRIDTCLMCHPEVSDQMASSHNHLVRYGENGCVACHSPHAGDDARLLKGKERHVCGTCHESTFVRHEEAEFSHEKTDACTDCHASHGSNHPAMMRGPINEVCGECHSTHATFSHPIGEQVFDPRTGQVMTCGSCHATKGTDHEYHTRFSGTKTLCVQCHTDH